MNSKETENNGKHYMRDCPYHDAWLREGQTKTKMFNGEAHQICEQCIPVKIGEKCTCDTPLIESNMVVPYCRRCGGRLPDETEKKCCEACIEAGFGEGEVGCARLSCECHTEKKKLITVEMTARILDVKLEVLFNGAVRQCLRFIRNEQTQEEMDAELDSLNRAANKLFRTQLTTLLTRAIEAIEEGKWTFDPAIHFQKAHEEHNAAKEEDIAILKSIISDKTST